MRVNEKVDVAFDNCSILWKDISMVRGWMIIVDGYIDSFGKGELHSSSIPKDVVKKDLSGSIISPGLFDSHMHLYQWAFSRKAVDLSGCRSVKEIIHSLQKERDSKIKNPYLEDLGILFGVDYDESRFPKGDDLTGNYLDQYFPDIPVIIRRICGHKAILNKRAIQELDISLESEKGGIIVEDEAMRCSWKLDLSRDVQAGLLDEAVSEMISRGLTGGLDIIHHEVLKRQQKAIKELQKDIRLSTCVDLGGEPSGHFGSHIFGDWSDFMSSHKDLSKNGQVIFSKYFLDGSIGARTASFSRDYMDAPREKTLMDASSLGDEMESSLKAGLIPMVHAIGDEAVSLFMDRFTELEGPSRIEHMEEIKKQDLASTKDHRFAVSMQPNFHRNWGGIGGMYDRALGEKWRSLNRFQDILEKANILAFGSDMMPMDPLYGIRASMDRSDPGRGLGLCDAIMCYSNKARSISIPGTWNEDPYSAGVLADLSIFDMDMKEVEYTIINGKLAYSGFDQY